MPRARPAARLVVLLLVTRDVSEADERLAQDGHTALALGRAGGDERARRTSIALWRELMLVSTRIRGTVDCGRLVVFRDYSQCGEDRLGVVKHEVAAEAEHELRPEFLLFCEELPEPLQFNPEHWRR